MKLGFISAQSSEFNARTFAQIAYILNIFHIQYFSLHCICHQLHCTVFKLLLMFLFSKFKLFALFLIFFLLSKSNSIFPIDFSVDSNPSLQDDSFKDVSNSFPAISDQSISNNDPDNSIFTSETAVSDRSNDIDGNGNERESNHVCDIDSSHNENQVRRRDFCSNPSRIQDSDSHTETQQQEQSADDNSGFIYGTLSEFDTKYRDFQKCPYSIYGYDNIILCNSLYPHQNVRPAQDGMYFKLLNASPGKFYYVFPRKHNLISSGKNGCPKGVYSWCCRTLDIRPQTGSVTSTIFFRSLIFDVF